MWHYKLLPVLPDKMLVAEWRECIAIKRQWEKGTLKHRLVSYIMDYDERLFLGYVKSRVAEIKLDTYDLMSYKLKEFKEKYLKGGIK